MEKSVYESVFNESPKHDIRESLSDVFTTLTGQQWSRAEMIAEDRRLHGLASSGRKFALGVDSESEDAALLISNTDRERIGLMYELIDMFSGDYENCNTLFDWPLYAKLIQDYGHKLSGGNALALGALTALSTRSFVKLAEEVYGADQAYVVDIMSGADKQKHGHFVFGDILRLPLQNASMDIVHSSNVLGKLQDPSGEHNTYAAQRQQVFAEAGRVLRPDGQLVMVESFPDIPVPREVNSHAEFYEHIRGVGDHIVPQLHAAGFGGIVVSEYRTSDYGFLYDRSRSLDQYFVPRPLLGTYAVHATKSPHFTPA